MALDSNIVAKFVEMATEQQPVKQTINHRATAKVTEDGEKYVLIDGSDEYTPCDSTVEVKDGERVTVTIENHTATITGSLSDPAVSRGDLSDLYDMEDKLGDAIVDQKPLYKLSSSSTEPPEIDDDLTGWTESVERTEGTYIWMLYAIMYMNESTQHTEPVCISGNDGKDGVDGEDGKDGQNGTPGVGISSVSSVYKRYTKTRPSAPTSSSQIVTTSDTDSWTSAIPTITTAYKYIWICTMVQLTNGTTTFTVPVISQDLGYYANFQSKIEEALDIQQNIYGTDYIISPNIGGGYVDISDSNGNNRVIIDPAGVDPSNPGTYMFFGKSNGKTVFSFDRSGNASFDGNVMARRLNVLDNNCALIGGGYYNIEQNYGVAPFYGTAIYQSRDGSDITENNNSNYLGVKFKDGNDPNRSIILCGSFNGVSNQCIYISSKNINIGCIGKYSNANNTISIGGNSSDEISIKGRFMNPVGNTASTSAINLVYPSSESFTYNRYNESFCGYRAYNEYTGVSVNLGIGAAGKDHGVYSGQMGKWIIYTVKNTDGTFTTHINGNKVEIPGFNFTMPTLTVSDIPNLPASKITSEQFGIDRLPTGISNTTVALGNHTHEYLPLSGGSLTGYLNTSSMFRTNGVSGVSSSNSGGYLSNEGVILLIGTGTASRSARITFKAQKSDSYYKRLRSNSAPSSIIDINLPSSGGTLQISSSDVRLKDNIADSTIDALDFITRIKIRQFDWISQKEGHQDIGFVADELEELDSKLSIGGGYDDNGEIDVKCVDSFYLQGYEVKAIQELSALVKELQNQVNTLKERIDQK